jgi:hypothetical protein
LQQFLGLLRRSRGRGKGEKVKTEYFVGEKILVLKSDAHSLLADGFEPHKVTYERMLDYL